MNWIKSIFKWFGGSSPKRTNVIDYSKPIPIGKAMNLARDGGFRVRRVHGDFDYIDFKDGKFWQHRSDGTVIEYFPEQEASYGTIDYMSGADWVICGRSV